MEYLIGVGLAGVVCAFLFLAGFDRDRVCYPMMLAGSGASKLQRALPKCQFRLSTKPKVPILRNALVLVVGGLGLGLACTWMATRLLKSFLFGVGQHDPLTVVTVSVLIVSCGLMAAFVPARRAASINPMQALRME